MMYNEFSIVWLLIRDGSSYKRTTFVNNTSSYVHAWVEENEAKATKWKFAGYFLWVLIYIYRPYPFAKK